MTDKTIKLPMMMPTITGHLLEESQLMLADGFRLRFDSHLPVCFRHTLVPGGECILHACRISRQITLPKQRCHYWSFFWSDGPTVMQLAACCSRFENGFVQLSTCFRLEPRYCDRANGWLVVVCEMLRCMS